MKSPLLPAVLLGAAFAATPLLAVTETDASNTTSQSFYDGFISAEDLINLASPSLSNWTSSIGATASVNTAVSGIFNGTANSGGNGNDGLADGSLTYLGSREPFGSAAVLNDTPVLTFYFNLDNGSGGSSTGYTLTSIQGINGWRDFGSMSDQLYSISISTDPNQLNFSTFYTVDYHPFDPSSDLTNNDQPNSSQVLLTDLDLSGVTAIQFTFSPYTNGSVNQAGQLIREIDVFGTATVPEPASVALLLAGGAALFVVRRHRV